MKSPNVSRASRRLLAQPLLVRHTTSAYSSESAQTLHVERCSGQRDGRAGGHVFGAIRTRSSSSSSSDMPILQLPRSSRNGAFCKHAKGGGWGGERGDCRTGHAGFWRDHKNRVSLIGDFNESDDDGGDGTPFVTFDNGGSSCGGDQWQQQPPAPRVVCATRDPSPPRSTCCSLELVGPVRVEARANCGKYRKGIKFQINPRLDRFTAAAGHSSDFPHAAAAPAMAHGRLSAFGTLLILSI